MEIFQLKELIHAINGEFIIGDPNFLAEGVSIDSRTIRKGEVYFAIKGERYDGHDFIKEAIDKGASAIVYSNENLKSFNNPDRFPSLIKTNDTLAALGKFAKSYREKFKHVNIVGITGSNGKTITKEILSSILNQKGKTLSNIGNFNNRIGLPLSIFNLTSEHKYAVFELGTSLYGEIKILSDILNPDEGVVTNIGFSHLRTFVSPEGVFKEKKILFENVKENGCVIVNTDDKFLKLLKDFGKRRVIAFGLDSKADLIAKNIKLSSEQTVFEICFNNESVEVFMPACGRFNVYNALAAAACAVGFAIPLVDIKLGIESFIPPKMRMETVVSKNGAILINDAYNANPSSMRNSIEAVLQSYPDKKINLVLGDMFELGDKSDEYHFELGKFLSDQKIYSINLIGDAIFNAKTGLGGKKNVFYAAKRSKELLDSLKSIDVDENSIFFFKASRGMKLEEVFAKFHDFLEE